MFELELVGSVAKALARERGRAAVAVTETARAYEKKADRLLETRTNSGFGNMRTSRTGKKTGNIGKVWDSVTFPTGDKASLKPAIWLNVDERYAHIIDAFDRGAELKSKQGTLLAIPMPWAIADGLYPDNKTRRDGFSKFQSGSVGRDWISAAERKYGALQFVPSAKGGGWLFPKSTRKRKKYDYPVFRLVKSARLQKRVDVQTMFDDVRRDFPRAMASGISARLKAHVSD